MIAGSYQRRMREYFVRQFEPDGADFIFRRNMTGAGYRVSAAERDAFIADFNRKTRRNFWGLLASTILLIVGFTGVSLWLHVDPKLPSVKIAMVVAFIVLIALVAAGSMRFYAAPLRVLERRSPVSGALSPDEKRRLAFNQITWTNLGIAAALVVFFPLNAAHWHPFVGWNRIWLAVLAVGLSFVAIQAVRKWRFDHET